MYIPQSPARKVWVDKVRDGFEHDPEIQAFCITADDAEVGIRVGELVEGLKERDEEGRHWIYIPVARCAVSASVVRGLS